MSWERGAAFRIVGAVVRRFVPDSGKCAFLTLAVPGVRGEVKHECRTFDLLIVEEIRGLGVGQVVQVSGRLDREAVKNKKREPVIVDGREAWAPALTIAKLDIEGSSRRAGAGAAQPEERADKPAEEYFR